MSRYAFFVPSQTCRVHVVSDVGPRKSERPYWPYALDTNVPTFFGGATARTTATAIMLLLRCPTDPGAGRWRETDTRKGTVITLINVAFVKIGTRWRPNVVEMAL